MYQDEDTQTRPLPEIPSAVSPEPFVAPLVDPSPDLDGPKRSKFRLALLIGIGIALIAAVVVTAVFLLRPAGNATDTSPVTQTEAVAPVKPSPEAEEKPSAPTGSAGSGASGNSAPPVHAPSDPTVHDQQVVAFTSFQPSGAAVVCTDDSQVYPITFSWQSQNAVAAWFGVDTTNAQAAPLQEVAPTGSMTWDFFCGNQATTYTVTIADASGNLAHRSVVVERQ